MSKFEWSDQYSVGNELLDRQHEGLMKLCGKAAACLGDRGRKGAEEFDDILTEMNLYALEHFRTEEAILEENGYVDLDVHRREHDWYLHMMVDFLRQAVWGHYDQQRIHHFLVNWWLNHIQLTDMHCRPFLA